jgi:hypothetical protein
MKSVLVGSKRGQLLGPLAEVREHLQQPAGDPLEGDAPVRCPERDDPVHVVAGRLQVLLSTTVGDAVAVLGRVQQPQRLPDDEAAHAVREDVDPAEGLPAQGRGLLEEGEQPDQPGAVALHAPR